MKKLIALVLAVSLAACAQMGLTTDTFNKRVAAAYETIQTLDDAAAIAVNSGKLSKADGLNVAQTSKTALTAIDMAVGLHSTDPKAGEDKLAATLAILTALQAYVATQGAK